MSAAGVWQLEPEVNMLKGLEVEGPELTLNSTILLAHSQRNFDWPPEAHQKQCQ